MIEDLLYSIGVAIIAWIKSHLSELCMGIGGALVVALMPSEKSVGRKLAEFATGVTLAACLSTETANFFTNGNGAGVFGFIYGMGGITLAKIILKAIEKKATEKAGVSDDNVS